ncbi:MAG: zinc ribbon domain-containing protein [Pseudomonadota bacterium]
MFFFIAGIQPKTVELDGQPRMCPSCGLVQARLKRVDHYLSLFFLPVFRVKKGATLVECRRCGHLSPEAGGTLVETPGERGPSCPYCGTHLDPAFRFCPSCGKRAG